MVLWLTMLVIYGAVNAVRHVFNAHFIFFDRTFLLYRPPGDGMPWGMQNASAGIDEE
jgi:hypothetical protein